MATVSCYLPTAYLHPDGGGMLLTRYPACLRAIASVTCSCMPWYVAFPWKPHAGHRIPTVIHFRRGLVTLKITAGAWISIPECQCRTTLCLVDTVNLPARDLRCPVGLVTTWSPLFTG